MPIVGPIPTAASPVTPTEAIAIATEIYYVLSGRTYGLSAKVLRPNRCANSCQCRLSSQYGYSGFSSWSYDYWRSTGCRCQSEELILPLVHSIEQVVVGGVALAPTAYALYDRHRLVKTDGTAWPCCQSLASATAANSIVVAATVGTPVPAMGVAAVKEMACQILAIGTAACRLPARVQSITRQGVTATILDPQDFLTAGRTGLYLGDLFLTTVNPKSLRRPTTVLSPDSPRVSVVS